MQLLNDISREYNLQVKLHFEIRLTPSDFDMDTKALHEHAEEMVMEMWTPAFKSDLTHALDAAAAELDSIDYARYGWMSDNDVNILNAFAVPIGNVRPYDYEIDDKVLTVSAGSYSSTNMFLLFIALLASIVLVVVLCMYYRLKAEHSALSKRKSMGGSLHQMWNKFSSARHSMMKKARDVVAGSSPRRTARMGTYAGDRSYLEDDTNGVQMSRWSAAGDDQIEEEDYQ
jgi:hypothetical protein